WYTQPPGSHLGEDLFQQHNLRIYRDLGGIVGHIEFIGHVEAPYMISTSLASKKRNSTTTDSPRALKALPVSPLLTLPINRSTLAPNAPLSPSNTSMSSPRNRARCSLRIRGGLSGGPKPCFISKYPRCSGVKLPSRASLREVSLGVPVI